MRFLTATLILAVALPAAAQSGARPVPPGSVPLDDPPPPPPITEKDVAEPTPQVTTRETPDETIQEYRINGKLYMQRVTPKHGKEYVLIDNAGDGNFTRMDENNLTQQLRVPQWVLWRF
jgi:hypothetical protein